MVRAKPPLLRPLRLMVARMFAAAGVSAQRAAQTCRVVVLGIDPDVNGSMAVFHWEHVPLAPPMVLDLSSAEVRVYDMPHVFYTLKGKSKAGKVITRKCATARPVEPTMVVAVDKKFQQCDRLPVLVTAVRQVAVMARRPPAWLPPGRSLRDYLG
jgi:hypothetical protein